MSESANDLFGAIAMHGDPIQPDQPLLRPPSVTWQDLNAIAEPFEGTFPTADRMRSQVDFDSRLAELREAYKPWLRNLVPPVDHARPEQPLEQFGFRFEEPEDLTDAMRAGANAGAWKAVKIPHYTGPATRWRAYYRTEFDLHQSLRASQTVWLCFRGVDYRCQVFVNGHFVGQHEGFFAPFEFDITAHLLRDRPNVLLVRVENDAVMMGNMSWLNAGGTIDQGDKIYAATGLGWDEAGVGWHHCPPGAGIYQPVSLQGRPATFIGDLFARPDIARKTVELTLEINVTPFARVPVAAHVSIFPKNFSGNPSHFTNIDLKPAGPGLNEYRLDLPFDDFELWAPTTPHLYCMRVSLLDPTDQRSVTDCRDVQFGMRSFRQETDAAVKGAFYLNDQRVILRGANTMGHEQRAVFEGNLAQLVDDILIAKMANLNFLRITQRPVQREVYDACDELGMMVQTDLPLFGVVRRGKVEEVARQAGEMERLIRSHPSCVTVSFINEAMNPDHPEVNGFAHRHIDRRELLDLLDCCRNRVHLYNRDRVVKEIDGDYYPPQRSGMPDRHCYCGWYGNHALPIGKLHAGYLFHLPDGWLGGCGEYGSEGLDPWATMQRHYPKEWLPAEGVEGPWNPSVIVMAQTASMQPQWFDKQQNVLEWIEQSQRHQAWVTRLQTDALRRRADRITSSAIHLLIDAYPAGWMKALVSVDRIAKPAYFAYADALAPLAVHLRTDRFAVWGGERIAIELWAFSDRDVQESAVGHSIVFEVVSGDSVIESRRVPATVRPYAATPQGYIHANIPHTDQRHTISIRATLLDANQHCLHTHELEIEAFPRPGKPLAGVGVAVIGPAAGLAANFARELGATVTPFAEPCAAEVLLVESAVEYEKVADIVSRYLTAGGRAIFLEQAEAGTWNIASHTIGRNPVGPHHFVSTKTGHPAVEAMKPRDLFMWFNPVAGQIDPLIEFGLEAPELIPIALSTSSDSAERTHNVYAAGELRIEQGAVILTQVKSLQMLGDEPRAARYLLALIQHIRHADCAGSWPGNEAVKPAHS